MITIRCDHIDERFHQCPNELSGLAFNAKPASWSVEILNEHGDHREYCPEHQLQAAAPNLEYTS